MAIPSTSYANIFRNLNPTFKVSNFKFMITGMSPCGENQAFNVVYVYVVL